MILNLSDLFARLYGETDLGSAVPARRQVVRLLPMILLSTLSFPETTAQAKDTVSSAPRWEIERPDEGWFARNLRINRGYPHLDMAYRLESQGDLKGALTELDTYLRIDPLDDNVRLQRARLLTQIGEDKRARVDIDILIARHPDDAELYMRRAELARRAGNLAGTKAELERGLLIPNLDREQQLILRMTLANLALVQADPTEALQQAELAEELAPSFSSAFVEGLARSALGQHQAALDTFNRAAKRNVNTNQRARAIAQAAEEAIKLKRYDTARDLLTELRLIEDPNGSISARLGNLSLQLEDTESALRNFRNALRLGDQNAGQSLTNLLISIGKLNEAKELVQHRLDQISNSEERQQTLLRLGEIEEQQGDLNAAAKAISEAVDIQPSAPALAALARIERQLGHPKIAKRTYWQSLQFASTPDIQYELAMLFATEGEVAKAADLLREARLQGLSRDKELSGWRQIGLSALAAGQPALAEEALGKALQGDPGDTTLGEAQADAALAQGAYAKAAGRYRRLAEQQRKRRALTDDIRALLDKAATSWVLANSPDKAIAVKEEILNLPGLGAEARAKVLVSVSYLYQNIGDPIAAAHSLHQAAVIEALPATQRGKIFTDIANIELALGDTEAAATAFRNALATGLPQGPDRAQAMQELAQILSSADPRGAEALLREALDEPELSITFRGQIHYMIGQLALTQGDFVEAATQFRKGLASGIDQLGLIIGLSNALAGQGKIAAAKELLERKLKLRPSWRMELAIALSRIYGAQNQPGLAVYTLSQVEGTFDRLAPNDRRVVYRQYGYYLEQIGQFEAASSQYTRSLELGYAPDVAAMLARTQSKMGRYIKAEATGVKIDPASLQPADRRQWLNVRAKVAVGLKQPEEALERFATAIAEVGDAETQEDTNHLASLWYETGGIYADLGDHERSAEAYARAVELVPSPAHMVAQGYQELALDHLDEARLLLDAAIAQEPDYIDAHQDLGYIAMQQYDNPAAIDHFRTAIDLNPLMTIETSAQDEERQQDLHRLRGEVRGLENRFDLDLYLTATSGESGVLEQPKGLGQDLSRTDSGLELAWIPPSWGFRDQRIFRFIGRLTWLMHPSTLEVDDGSLAAAIGVRYKPFKRWNLNIGLEKFFGIGQNTSDQTVIRILGSITDGAEINPVETHWNYSYLFAEVDGYLEDGWQSGLYAELRQGVTFKMQHDITLTPFLVADTRLWSDSKDNSFIEGGIGLLVRFPFKGTKYALSSQNVDLLLTYKAGQIFGSSNIQDDSINALFATLSFHY